MLDTLPVGCELAGGVTFEVEVDGEVLGRFVTASEGPLLGIFVIEVPLGAEVVITEVTTPPGFEPRENPIAGVIEAPLQAAVFVNLPEGDVGPVVPRPSRDPSASRPPLPIPPARPIVRATPRPSVTPPATDTGDTTGRSSDGPVMLVLVGLTLGTAGLLLLAPPRRRRGR